MTAPDELKAAARANNLRAVLNRVRWEPLSAVGRRRVLDDALDQDEGSGES